MILRYDQGMNTPNETPDHPLTETAAAELSKKFMPGVAFQILASVSPEDLTEYARAAFDAGQKYQDDLEDDTIRNIMKDVHHLRVERDTADNVVADLTARLDAERFAHANTAVKVKGVEALADRLSAEAADDFDGVSGTSVSLVKYETAKAIRTALNGENR